jgi:hypothetical protein
MKIRTGKGSAEHGARKAVQQEAEEIPHLVLAFAYYDTSLFNHQNRANNIF